MEIRPQEVYRMENRIAKLEEALKLIMNILDDDPDWYAHRAYSVASEALGKGGMKEQTSLEPADCLSFTGEGDPGGVPDTPGGYDSEVWSGGRRVIGHKSE